MTANLPDPILTAKIIGAAGRHSRFRPLTGAEHEAAVTEIAGIAAGRADLLAQCARILAGSHHGELDEARYLQAAQLCLDAGADATQVGRWISEGRRRADDAHASRTQG